MARRLRVRNTQSGAVMPLVVEIDNGDGTFAELGVASAAEAAAGENPNKALTPSVASNLASVLAAFTGDSGEGGVKGLVPAPAAGDAAAGKFLKADGAWAVPAHTIVPGGRLTLTTGMPVTSSDVTAAGTLYYTPHTHNIIHLYSGSAWVEHVFTEPSLALTLTVDKNYDVFIYNNAGTLTLELSAAWASDSSRTDALARQDGIWVKEGAATRRWIGTIRASASNQTEDSKAKRFVWNAYNQVQRPLYKAATTASWFANTSIWRRANDAAEQRIEWVNGSVQYCELNQLATAIITSYNGEENFAYSGIGLDDDTTPVPGWTLTSINNFNATDVVVTRKAMHTEHRGHVGEGLHFAQALENSNSPSDPTFEGNGSVANAYISGMVMA